MPAQRAIGHLRKLVSQFSQNFLTVTQTKAQPVGGVECEAANGIASQMQQTLSNRHGIHGQKDAIHDRVPAGRLSTFDGVQVSLQQAMIFQCAQLAQLPAAHRATRCAKGFHARIGSQFRVQLKQFAQLAPVCVLPSSDDRRKFNSGQGVFDIVVQQRSKLLQGSGAVS